jgi:HEAT repeat protein
MIRHRFLVAFFSVLAIVCLLPSFALAVGPAADEATRVRILLVIDTHGYNETGLAFARDGDRLERRALELQRLVGKDRCTVDALRGAHATSERILEYYAKLKTSANEALVCYYNGHGMTEWPRGHYFAMAAGRLYRTDLRQAMARHNPRLLVILSDCCANDYGQTTPINIEEIEAGIGSPLTSPGRARQAAPSPPVPGADLRAPASKGQKTSAVGPQPGPQSLLRQLLFHPRGLVDITSSTLGTSAFSSFRKGSFFTLALDNLLGGSPARPDLNGDGRIDWTEFFTALQAEARARAARNGIPQIAEAFALPGVGGPVSGTEAAGRSPGGQAREAKYWIMSMQSCDPEVRLKAVLALGVHQRVAGAGGQQLVVDDGDSPQLPDAKAATVIALQKALRDADGRVRRAAAQTLGWLGAAAQPALPDLMAALRNAEDPVLQSRAVLALAGMGKAAIPALLKALQDEDCSVRRRAAEALAHGGRSADRAVPPLLEALRDEDLVVRRQALRALQACSQHDWYMVSALQAIPAMIRALRAEDMIVRRYAASSLGHFGPLAFPAVPALLQASGDEDSQLRSSALWALGRIRFPSGEVTAVILTAVDDPEPAVRLEAVWALEGVRRADMPAARHALIRAMGDENADVRQAAVDIVSNLGQAPSCEPQLLECARDTNCRVRAAAIGALGNGRRVPATLPILAGALRDPAGTVRKEALRAVGRFGPSDAAAVPTLIAALQDGRPSVRRAAAVGLENIGQAAQPAVPALLRLLEDRDQRVMRQAAMALARIAPSNRASVPVLIAFLRDREAADRFHAAYILALIDAKEAIPALVDVLREDAGMFTPAANALKQLRAGARAVPPLIEGLKDKRSGVRIAAAYALGNLGPEAKAAIPALTALQDDSEPRVRRAGADAVKRIMR